MAVDKNKITAEATKLVQKGAFDKAIKTYERILAEDPKDVRVLLKVGELHQKKGDDRQAAEAFKRVAETYADQGFFLKAVAVYKQIVKLDPEDVRVNERLAALYQQLGLMSDAMAQFQLMAGSYERSGDHAALLDVLRRMVELDPENIASSIKLGELYQRANQGGPALEHFRRAADYLKHHNRADEYLKVAERIAALAPDDLALTRELANIYLAKGDTKRALSKLQLSFKADPKDVETLNLLAQAFRELGQTGKTLSVYKELARVHEERSRPAEARAVWRKVLDLAADDPDATAALGAATPASVPAAAPSASQAPRPGPAPAAPAAAPRPPPPGPPPGARAPATQVALRPQAVAPAAQGPAPSPRPPTAQGPEAIPKLLTETDVYLKYGLLDKALDHLRKVLSIDPESPEAHEKARDIHQAAGRAADAEVSAEAAVRACLAKHQEERARAALERLRQLAPDHRALAELTLALGGTDEIQLGDGDVEEVTLPPGGMAIEVEPEVEFEAEAEPLEPVETIDLVPAGTGEMELADAAADVALDGGLGFAEAEEVGPALEDEPLGPGLALPTLTPLPSLTPLPGGTLEAVLEPVRAAPLEDDDLAMRAVAAAAELGEEEVVEEPEPEPQAPPAVLIPAPSEIPDLPKPPAHAAGRVEEAEEEADLSDELEEADFFVQQGLLDEAREALKNLQAFYPDHRQVVARLADLDRRAAALAPVPAAPAPAAAAAATAAGAVRQSPSLVAPGAAQGESFDIAAELAEELDGATGPITEDEFQYSVEDVFNQFKKGVAETVKAEDSDTHYDLGIAYKEMGLLDDAISEFEQAVRGSNRKKEVDCLSMVGLCRMAQGRPKDAVEALRRALRSDYLTKEAAKAIHFDLASAYEASGDAPVALWYFQKVAKADAGYRQATQRVAALGGGPGRPPADEAGAATGSRAGAPGPAKPAVPGAKKNIGYL